MRYSRISRWHETSLKVWVVAAIAFGGFWSSDTTPGLAQTRVPPASSDRRFTVRDAIEMSHFIRLGNQTTGGALFSPNNRYFAVLTSRGIVRSNKVESTIRVFLTAEVMSYLSLGRRPPRARIVAEVSEVPQSQSFSSYPSIISRPQWLYDSSGLLFLAEGAHGEHRLYEANISTGATRVLSQGRYDVNQFTSTKDTILYAATPLKRAPVGDPINADAAYLSGPQMLSALFPENPALDFRYRYMDLWIVRGGKRLHVAIQGGSHPLSPLPYGGLNPLLRLSQDGRLAVILLPAKSIPTSWADYVTPPYSGIDPSRDYQKFPGPFPVLEYTLLDLETGKAVPLVQGPDAVALSFIARSEDAIWSPDGKRILLTGVFFPLNGVDPAERLKRRYPCIAAVVEVSSDKASCVTAFASDQYVIAHSTALQLQTATFGGSDNDVILRITHPTTTSLDTVDRAYHYENGQWDLAKSTVVDPSRASSQMLSVAIKQDLNTPPSVWATRQDTLVSKELWDPNPQLAGIRLGDASVFRWKDAAGYEWTGVLVKPPDFIRGKRYPLVIQSHGVDLGSFLADGFSTTGTAARPMASAGIMVLQTAWFGNAADLGTQAEAVDAVRGYKSAIAQLDMLGLVDPKKVGVIGFSRTCWHVETALISDPDLFAAASINDGIDESYMQYMFFSIDGLGDNREPEKIYGTKPFGAGLATWVDKAPGFNLDRVRSPVLIGAVEQFSLFDEWELYSSLLGQHKPVDLMYIPGGQHVLQKPLDRMASQQGNVDWFRFWLQGYEDPSPAKKTQYARWRAFRVAKP